MVRDFQARRAQTKRRFRQIDSNSNGGHHHELEVVDDLAHAAQFAIVPPLTNTGCNSAAATTTSTSTHGSAALAAESVGASDPAKKHVQEDGNEIEVDDSDDDVSDASIADGAGIDGDKEADKDNDKEDNDDDSSDDDESDDEDLVEAMQRMEQATAREEEAGLTTSNAPKTENEVDGYKVPIRELESQLQIRLTVDDESTTTAGAETAANTKNKNITENQLSLAGTIQNYMVVDRTVVVASAAVSPSSSSGPQAQATGPLDEGSLLVVKMQQHAANASANTDGDGDGASSSDAATTLIPLGRIFEVFGPVSQPLYTIRLPSPPSSSKDKQKLPPNRNKSSKKNSKKIHPATEAKEVNEKGDSTTATVDGNQDGTKSAPSDIEIREGEIMSDAASPPEVSEKANETTAMDEESSSPSTEIDTVGKDKNNASENDDTRAQPQSLLCEDKESSSTRDKEGPGSMAETTTPGSSNDNDAAPEKVVVDMWAVDGDYAKFLSRNKNIEVYYIQDEAKLIDTGFVMRSSGKGCDASNIYDEEIINTNEAYYSDDEKEREAKNKKKGAGRKKNQKRNADREQHDNRRQQHNNNSTAKYPNNNNAASTGYYGQPPPPPQNYGYGQRHHGSLPQGFHHHMAQQRHHQHQYSHPHGRVGQQTQHPTHHQYPPGSAFHRQASGAPPPPPPPPQGQHNQSYPYQQGAPQRAQRQAPPPPPPRNSNEPPAYQY